MLCHEQIIADFPVVEKNVFSKFVLEFFLPLGLDGVDEGAEDLIGFEKRVGGRGFGLWLVGEDLEGFFVVFVNIL